MLSCTLSPVLKNDADFIGSELLRFITHFNIDLCPLHGIEKRSITMRDI